MDILNYSNIVELTATPALLSALQYVYDTQVSKYSSKHAQYDFAITFASLIASKVVSNAFVAKMVGVLNSTYASNLSSYLTSPVVCYFIYAFLYERFITFENLGSHASRSSQEIILMSAALGFLQQYLDPMVLSKLTGYTKSYEL